MGEPSASGAENPILAGGYVSCAIILEMSPSGAANMNVGGLNSSMGYIDTTLVGYILIWWDTREVKPHFGGLNSFCWGLYKWKSWWFGTKESQWRSTGFLDRATAYPGVRCDLLKQSRLCESSELGAFLRHG